MTRPTDRMRTRRLTIAFMALLVMLLTSLIPPEAAAQLLPGGGSAADNGGSSEPGSGSDEPSRYWWRIDALNPSLPAPPATLRRDTPRIALEGFIDAAERKDFATASQLLNFALLPEQPTPERAAELARMLYEVLNRKLWIDWAALPDRPDGVDVVAASSSPFAGEPRRAIRLGIIDLEGRPVSIWIERLKPRNGEPVWLIAGESVARTEALYLRHGPKDFERRLPEWLLQPSAFGLPLWQIVGFPLILVGGLAVGWIAFRLVGSAQRPVRNRQWLNRVVERARLPVALLASAGLIWWLTSSLLSFTGPLNTLLAPLLLGLIVIAVTLGILRVLDILLDVFASRYIEDVSEEENSEARRLLTNLSVLRRVIILVAFLVGAGALIIQLNLSQTLGVSLLASAGILTLILGFAAQTVLGNILASIQIAIAKPIRIGDAVFYEGAWGYVEEINYTYVLIRIWDERRFVVPVRYFVSNPFENWSIRNPGIVKPVELQLDYRADIAELRQVFEAMLRDDEDWDEEQEPKILVIAQDAEAMTVRFYLSAKDSSAAWNLHCRIREKLIHHIGTQSDWFLPRQRVASVGDGTDAAKAGAATQIGAEAASVEA